MRKILTLVEVAVLAVLLFFLGYVFNKLKQKELNKVLVIATGALTNSTTPQQGESIPGIDHAIAIENKI